MDRTETSDQRDAVVYTAASALGIIAGMRTMTAPATVAYLSGAGCSGADREDFGVLGRPALGKAVMVLAGLEAIADKLPFMPNRTKPVPLAARLLIGGICGATICSAMKRSKLVGAVAGTFGALGSTFAVCQIRNQISQGLGVPDSAVALIEDASALWVAKAVCQGLNLASRQTT